MLQPPLSSPSIFLQLPDSRICGQPLQIKECSSSSLWGICVREIQLKKTGRRNFARKKSYENRVCLREFFFLALSSGVCTMYDVHARARGGGTRSNSFLLYSSPLYMCVWIRFFLPPDFRETGGRWGGGICMNKPRQNWHGILFFFLPCGERMERGKGGPSVCVSVAVCGRCTQSSKKSFDFPQIYPDISEFGRKNRAPLRFSRKKRKNWKDFWRLWFPTLNSRKSFFFPFCDKAAAEVWKSALSRIIFFPFSIPAHGQFPH